MSDFLFPLPDAQTPAAPYGAAGPRVQRPNRTQLEFRPVDLESLLPEDHRARLVWEFVEGMDLRPFYETILAVDGHAGRPAIDPAILLALWLYATLEGVGSARAVARLCEEHDGYRWICGGVSVNYHTLADFRVADPERLDDLLTASVAALLAQGSVELTRVAQDGLRVRASAGSGSFRREERLQTALAAAAAQVRALREDVTRDPDAPSPRQLAAQRRAAEDRRRRVAEALAQLPEFQARRQRAKVKGPARLSMTDPDARVMKMPDGGFRPAFNVQFLTTMSQVVVGVRVSNAGTDLGQLTPMVEQMRRRYGQTPRQLLADGGFVDLTDLRTLALQAPGCLVYAPPKDRDDPAQSPVRWPDDAPIAGWRQRMATSAAQAIYRERAAASECINAQARNRGLRHVLVRGLQRVRAAVLWYALAQNVASAARLRTVRLAT